MSRSLLKIFVWSLPALCFLAFTAKDVNAAGTTNRTNSGEVKMRITVDAPATSKSVRVWIPYPVSDEYQKIDDVKISGNYASHGIYKEEINGNSTLYAEWNEPVSGERFVEFSFKATATERSKKNIPSTSNEFPAEIRQFIKPTNFIPTGGKIKDIADEAVKGKTTTAEKARAIYDWVVENTERDPNVKGCGVGDAERTLAEKGGKCADISSVYVALARAAGVPSREVFGLRLGNQNGDAQQDMTSGHHCWSEFYVNGYGWVPVDPADVRKIMLVSNLDLDKAKEYREYYFGAVEANRIALGHGGRGYYLNPKQSDGPLNYFMYPYAEVDGKSLEWLAAQKELKYQIIYSPLTEVSDKR